MTTYRLFPSTNGPTAATNFTGAYIAGVLFEVTKPGMWFEGYWWWCCNTGQATAPVECALWQPYQINNTFGSVLVPGTTATSGTLTPGAWNYIPLATPVPIAVGTPYTPAIAQNGSFPDEEMQFGSGDPFTNGIVNGPLLAYSSTPDGGASNGTPYYMPQGIYTTAGSDPTVYPPISGNNASNLWADVQVSDTAPASYAGTYRLWPNKFDSSATTLLDAASPFTLAIEIHFSEQVITSWLWFYSPRPTQTFPAGAASLPTWAGVYPAAGTPGITAPVAQNSSPSWRTPDGSAAATAGGGWCKCAVTATLPAGQYKVAVYNSGGAAGGWSPADYGYFLTGTGANGITGFGPVSSPAWASGADAYVYTSNPSASPPYAQGTIEPANGTFAQDSSLISGAPQYPYLVVDYNFDGPAGAIAESFYVDLEVTPVVASGASAFVVVLAGGSL